MDAITLERNKSSYLSQDRSVNLKEHFEREEKLEASGLKDIEIRDKVKSLGKDDFLKLLVTQLSHQDPTEPVKDQQFIAQMAQFSSLEQMQNISKSIGSMSDRQSYTLVGKWIMGPDSQNGQMQSGLAEALLYDEASKPFLRVNGKTVAVEDVKVVSEPSVFQKANSQPQPPANSEIQSRVQEGQIQASNAQAVAPAAQMKAGEAKIHDGDLNGQGKTPEVHGDMNQKEIQKKSTEDKEKNTNDEKKSKEKKHDPVSMEMYFKNSFSNERAGALELTV